MDGQVLHDWEMLGDSDFTDIDDVRCAFFDRGVHSRSAVEFHAFAPIEVLPCV
jgi:hypothetical protein